MDEILQSVNKLNNIRERQREELHKNREKCLKEIYYENLERENKQLRVENIKLIEDSIKLRKENKKLKEQINKRKYIKRSPEEKIVKKEYDNFRKKILQRDKYTCQVCGSKHRLQVHHIKPRKDFPELIMEESNCITLCITCHSKTASFFTT